MAPKAKKGDNKDKKGGKNLKNVKTNKLTPTATTDNQTDFYESEDSYVPPRYVSLSLHLKGDPIGPGEFNILAVFNGLNVLEGKWRNGEVLRTEALPLNLSELDHQTMVANAPLVLILRAVVGKGAKDPDPLLHPDNRAGASVDLFPLVLGEQEVLVKTRLVSLATGERSVYSVVVHAISPGIKDDNLIPLILTMISIHCVPSVKDGTVYLSAIGLNGLHRPHVINFNMSLSTSNAEKNVFAQVSHAGFAANTAMNVHTEDKFIPDDLKLQNENGCRAFYWNAIKRVLVYPEELYDRLATPFMIEVAGVPRAGKVDIRGRYMGQVDARVLLEPGQIGVTICTKLIAFSESKTLDNIGALLDLPPVSAKASAREPDPNVTDEYGHSAYAIIRLDLSEALVPKCKIENLYDIIGFPPPESSQIKIVESESNVHLDPVIDARSLRKEGGALAVHKELSGLACKGMIPMTQGIKRTAANRLLMRVRTMLKNFPPGECSNLDWEDTVTGQHTACRRAVTASFAPQPPPLHLSDKFAASRCRIAGDHRIADKHIQSNLKVAGNNPRSLIAKSLRCLEERNDVDAKNYLIEALSSQSRNRYLLWILGGLEFDQDNESAIIAGAALRIAVKGDYSDGTANSIGWAALHTFHHCNGNIHAAFVAAKKMRKAFSLPIEWGKFIERWTEISGEEEIYWVPSVICTDNPILLAAAFFLCLRCYKFTEKLLQCVEQGCATRNSSNADYQMTVDVYYLRAASLILRREFDLAMDKILLGVNNFGPTPIMSQMRVTCLTCIGTWDRECEEAYQEAKKAGSELCSSLLYKASLVTFKHDPMLALQRVALAHRDAPSGHTALLIGRIYALLGKEWLAERWLAAAVNTEPLLADGWAMLALLAMNDKNLDKARVMLRTARQVGPISQDIEDEVKRVMDMVELDQLPDFLVKNLCLCDYI